ncbi:hypothetical protein D3C81_1493500 [compost metagenome]
MRAERFIEAIDVEIGAARLHIHQTVWRISDGVHAQLGSHRMDTPRHFGDWIDRADNIRGVGHGHIAGFVIEQDLQVIQLQLTTVEIDLPHAQGRTTAFAQFDPWTDVGLMIAIGDDDFITWDD